MSTETEIAIIGHRAAEGYRTAFGGLDVDGDVAAVFESRRLSAG